MKTVLTFFIFTQFIFCQSKIYNNSELGFSFDFSDSEYSPFGSTYNSESDSNSVNWNKFNSTALSISFKFPKGMIVKEGILDSFYGESTNDSSVSIGFNNMINDSIFYSVVEIFKSDKPFNEIAEGLFFEIDTASVNSDWIILGRQGLPSDAIFFEGENCKGLRGHTFVGFYYCNGGYAGLGDVFRTLLVLENLDDSKVVLFLDSAGTWDCVGTEGVPDDELYENTFFKIASTIKKLKN
jgi:hypothetical protein